MSEGDGFLASIPKPLFAEHYLKLPAVAKRRVKALKKLQHETAKIDVAFFKELFDLEVKYDKDHQNIFEKRKQIVSGEKEPESDECDWPSDDETPEGISDDVEKLCDDVTKKAIVTDEGDNAADGKLLGIPDFWLEAFKNAPLLEETIQPHDMKILKHLTDVKCVLHQDECGFSLEFHFSENDYFTNQMLSKRYFFNYEITKEEPYYYEGPEIVRAKGCVINWKPGKNVTVKVIKKVQKKKGGGPKRTITKNVQEDSFFNFFDPPTQTLSDDLDEDIHELLESDFRLGQFIRDTVIPKAVLYFTGEGSESCDEDEDDESTDDDDDDADEEDDSEEDEKPNRPRGQHKSGGHHKRADAASSGEKPECKQQ